MSFDEDDGSGTVVPRDVDSSSRDRCGTECMDIADPLDACRG